nr:MAG TPA: hypothetical protein [Caudoviricetes sp.]DAM54789.1 MAG TPA: hypothetical protein [Caudoviricetes sp.]
MSLFFIFFGYRVTIPISSIFEVVTCKVTRGY